MTADHPYTSCFHRLKVIMASGDKLVVPEDWIDGVTPKGNAWVGDGRQRYELQLSAEALPMEGDSQAMGGVIERRILERLRAFGASGQVDDAKLSRTHGSVLIEVVTDDPRAPAVRTYNWVRLVREGGELLEFGFHLLVLHELWERPETLALIDLFGQQIRNVAFPQDEPEGLGLSRLRAIHPFGFLTLRVPARWRDERDAESGEWFCGEDETDTGTLWIDYDVFQGNFDARGPERLVQKLGDAVAWRSPGEGWRRVGFQTFTEEAAVTLRFRRWFVIDWTAERAVMVTLTLVLQAAWDGDREFEALVAAMEREAATLAIGPLPG